MLSKYSRKCPTQNKEIKTKNVQRLDKVNSTAHLTNGTLSDRSREFLFEDIYEVEPKRSVSQLHKPIPCRLFLSTNELQKMKNANSKLYSHYNNNNIEYPPIKVPLISPQNRINHQPKYGGKLPPIQQYLGIKINEEFDNVSGKDKIRRITEIYTGITPKLISKRQKSVLVSPISTPPLIQKNIKKNHLGFVIRRKYLDDDIENA